MQRVSAESEEGSAGAGWLRSAFSEDRDWIARQAAVWESARGWKDDPGALSLPLNLARDDEKSEFGLAASNELSRGWGDDPEVSELFGSTVTASSCATLRRRLQGLGKKSITYRPFTDSKPHRLQTATAWG